MPTSLHSAACRRPSSRAPGRRRSREGSGADGGGVRVELMADCLAGMWAGHAATTVDPDTGVTFLEPITAQQLADAAHQVCPYSNATRGNIRVDVQVVDD